MGIVKNVLQALGEVRANIQLKYATRQESLGPQSRHEKGIKVRRVMSEESKAGAY